MKRILAALLAALLLFTLAACKKETAPENPEEPEITETQEPDETEPEEEDVPDESQEPSEPTEPSEPAEPSADGTAVVTDQVTEGMVEESISYRITIPEISTGDAAADQILSDYYASVAGKVEDLCYGELYEEALEAHTMYHVETEYFVEKNDGNVLSIRRTVIVADLKGTDLWMTMYAETFSLPGGGLMTAGDFFIEDPTDRLVAQVRRIISEDPYHDQNYDPQWSDLCASAFNKDQFYVTDDFFVVFYQDGDLGLGGRTVFEIPWDSLRDIVR